MKKMKFHMLCGLLALVSMAALVVAQEKAVETSTSKSEAKSNTNEVDSRNSYKNIEVAKFDAAPGVEFPSDFSKVVLDDTVKFLRRLKRFDNVTVEGDSATEQAVPTIRIVGTVTKFKAGSQAKRYLMGPFGGRTTVAVHVKFLDKSTGKVLFEKDFQGVVIGGLFGGDSKDSVYIIGQRISKAVKQEFTAKK